MIGNYGGSERYLWLHLERMLSDKECSDLGFVSQCTAALTQAKILGWSIDYDDVYFESNVDTRFIRGGAEFFSKFQCRVQTGSSAVARFLFTYFDDHLECRYVAGVVENLRDVLILPREVGWGPRVYPRNIEVEIPNRYGRALFYCSNY